MVAEQLAQVRLVASALLGFELANVCLVKTRWIPDQTASLRHAFGLRARPGVAKIAVDHDGVLALVTDTWLTVYDASYLWLARRLRTEPVTLDRRLARAMA
ncbi:MAG: type II toxin-antitoxin system VapC family toxin [Acetobacteraceae bacterium]